MVKKTEGKAIVFIHGFSGDPVTTWSDFPDSISRYSDFKGCDIFFYAGYELRMKDDYFN